MNLGLEALSHVFTSVFSITITAIRSLITSILLVITMIAATSCRVSIMTIIVAALMFIPDVCWLRLIMFLSFP